MEDKKLDKILQKISNLEIQQDKTLGVVLDTQGDVKDLRERVMHLEEQHEKTFNKLDGFLVLIQRHEVEIAALHSHVERLEDRIDLLEKKLATA